MHNANATECNCVLCQLAAECTPMFETILEYMAEHINAHLSSDVVDAQRIDAFNAMRDLIDALCDASTSGTQHAHASSPSGTIVEVMALGGYQRQSLN